MQALDADQAERPIAGDAPQHVHGDRGVLLVSVKADQRGPAVLGNIDEVAAMRACGDRSGMHELVQLGVAAQLVTVIPSGWRYNEIYCESRRLQAPRRSRNDRCCRAVPARGDRDLDALFVFAHGAGAGQFHPFMTGYAERPGRIAASRW